MTIRDAPLPAGPVPAAAESGRPASGWRTRVRAVVWNLLTGGLDGEDEERLFGQAEILRSLRPDILCLPECTRWNEDYHRRLWWMALRLDMKPVAMLRSRHGREPVENYTALLYRPSRFRVVRWERRGTDVFHHALIRALLRPADAVDDRDDVLVLGTHLSWTNGDARLNEVRGWMTDDAGEFPGVPPRGIVLADMNTPDREPESWDLIPANLHPRYRLALPDGTFGGADQRAVRMMLQSGWHDPQDLTGVRRAATVGYWYANEPVPWCLDYALVRGLDVQTYRTYDTPRARELSDHLPVVLDASWSGHGPATEART
ncbi:endonuclease/exonuclease/phosphatase family protein [Streptomyces chrestomyceticus]|uniref:endonuclease/exonuclease/phosphatase family protein n=1 Tax=Streptomyces chrestomyceticus TaxID=68185 RepID=UPI00369F64BD